MKSLIIALDLPSASEALALVDGLGERAGYFKVGAQLFTREGPTLVAELKDRDRHVFLDLKYHDIPNTVARAVEAAAELGVDMLTLHATGGSAMMAAARDAVGADGPLLMGVTLLTSYTAGDIEDVWGKELRSLREEVGRLAALVADAELDGVVASALEVETLKRKHGSDFLVVTPGIRAQGDDAGDQRRTSTPAAAVRAGADYLVIGRPIYGADDPAAAFDRLLAEVHPAGEVEAIL
jgi:orotidine-5'-phosphate decarboxylase